VKVTVEAGKCQGHAQCNANAPDLFRLDDDGYIAFETLDVPAGSEDAARRGAAACPERALTLAD
jgi:ferredoxin